jgi:hypothetical protein
VTVAPAIGALSFASITWPSRRSVPVGSGFTSGRRACAAAPSLPPFTAAPPASLGSDVETLRVFDQSSHAIAAMPTSASPAIALRRIHTSRRHQHGTPARLTRSLPGHAALLRKVSVMEDRRPPLPVRVLVLVAAIACLALAMCAHAPRSQNPPANASSNAGASGSGSSKGAPDAAPRANDPAYFGATKAASALYPQPEPEQQQQQEQRK